MRSYKIQDSILHLTDIPTPTCPNDNVIIQVKAAGVNYADILQVAGKYPPPTGVDNIPGLEVSGVITEVGRNVTDWQIGDKICALVSGCGYSEYIAIPANHLLPIPSNLDYIEAASLPEALCTVWLNLVDKGDLRKGQSVLIHGGSSGIGVAAIQVAKHLGATIFTTARTASKCNKCTELGADYAINYQEQDFVEICKANTGGKGVDLILDMVGGAYTPRNMKAIAPYGIIISIACLGGAKAEINLGALLMKNITMMGSTLRGCGDKRKAHLIADIKNNIWPIIENSKFIPVVDKVYPFEQAQDAHNYMQQSNHIGKIILEL